MATEPTLGERIMDAVDEHAFLYGEWLNDESENDAPGTRFAAQSAKRERLRALAARADAAERGMVAMGALVDELQAAFKREMSSIHRTPYTGVGHIVELARATEALAAWRAITEGNEVTG